MSILLVYRGEEYNYFFENKTYKLNCKLLEDTIKKHRDMVEQLEDVLQVDSDVDVDPDAVVDPNVVVEVVMESESGFESRSSGSDTSTEDEIEAKSEYKSEASVIVLEYFLRCYSRCLPLGGALNASIVACIRLLRSKRIPRGYENRNRVPHTLIVFFPGFGRPSSDALDRMSGTGTDARRSIPCKPSPRSSSTGTKRISVCPRGSTGIPSRKSKGRP